MLFPSDLALSQRRFGFLIPGHPSLQSTLYGMGSASVTWDILTQSDLHCGWRIRRTLFEHRIDYPIETSPTPAEEHSAFASLVSLAHHVGEQIAVQEGLRRMP